MEDKSLQAGPVNDFKLMKLLTELKQNSKLVTLDNVGYPV